MNKMYKYQEDGADFMASRTSSLLADEAGTGKTIQVCGLINKIYPQFVLVVCPAFLQLNWKRELEKWTTEKVRIITPDDKSQATNLIGVTIISYEMSRLMVQWYSQITFDLIVWDESHLLKNQNSLRSKAARLMKARKKVCLTGTPILSRPIELWHQLHLLNPIRWNDYWKFALKYCNATKKGQYWDVSGSSHADELNKILKTEIMIRRTKADVLPELPAKIRQIIEIPCNSFRELLLEEKKFYNELIQNMPASPANNLTDTFGESYADELSHMKGNNLYDMSMIQTLRSKTAMLKVPAIVEHVKNLVYQGQKVIVFTHHHQVSDALISHLDGALYADGRIKMSERDSICNRFQLDGTKRLLIAGLQALGVGVTLTEATVVVFAELAWNPSEITQGEDRVARIGLKHAVLIQHIVLQGSLDLDIAHSLVSKQSVINQILK